MQKKYDMIAKDKYCDGGSEPVRNHKVFYKQGDIPLDEFKILFIVIIHYLFQYYNIPLTLFL